ncbi:hypothetical protein VNI00_015409 [Paramarasmius palmivorus]|uniref:Uncharacterized protein n=1 Tax=Paramarasmius palmivorus TaxID=297713 RepID=A0AAW0BKB3_9AGAR
MDEMKQKQRGEKRKRIDLENETLEANFATYPSRTPSDLPTTRPIPLLANSFTGNNLMNMARPMLCDKSDIGTRPSEAHEHEDQVDSNHTPGQNEVCRLETTAQSTLDPRTPSVESSSRQQGEDEDDLTRAYFHDSEFQDPDTPNTPNSQMEEHAETTDHNPNLCAGLYLQQLAEEYVINTSKFTDEDWQEIVKTLYPSDDACSDEECAVSPIHFINPFHSTNFQPNIRTVILPHTPMTLFGYDYLYPSYYEALGVLPIFM